MIYFRFHRYTPDGHCRGEMEFQPPNPIRLQWEMPDDCLNVIENSLAVARDLAESVDLHLIMHDAFGKGLIKKCKTSPDAFIQLALQLAYYRVTTLPHPPTPSHTPKASNCES